MNISKPCLTGPIVPNGTVSENSAKVLHIQDVAPALQIGKNTSETKGNKGLIDHEIQKTDKGFSFLLERRPMEEYENLSETDRYFISEGISSTGLSIREAKNQSSQGATNITFLIARDTVTINPCAVTLYNNYNDKGEMSTNIGSIFVAREKRKQGIAKKLIVIMQDDFLKTSTHRLKEKFFAVRINPNNTASLSLFKSLEFKDAGNICQYKQLEKTIWKA
ncbi:N-acetyltransferase [Endozoicomonas ascidiicola]|uniref:N-acetyltransferase n=1 Tax=Endozoicomonas ascidiicola TaxID=1698521 RepID=UPI00082AF7AA|nr:N-acetyltransferase [Endozoicomonas ascidiicola]